MNTANIFSPPLSLSAGNRQRWGNLSGSASSLAIVNVARQQQLTVLITHSSAGALQMERELRLYIADDDEPLELVLLPDWETLPYDYFSPHQDIISERLSTLYRLAQLRRAILIVPITSLLQRLLPRDYLLAHSLVLAVGQQFDSAAMRRRLEQSGYRCVDTVYEHGEFALRGSIMDIYPMGSPQPYRIELLDDDIDTLRSFDPETQRTIQQVELIELLPGKEFPLDEAGIALFRRQWHEAFDVDHRHCPLYQDVSQGVAPGGIEYYLPLFFEQCSTLLDYLPETCMFFHFAGLEDAAEQFLHDVKERYVERSGDVQRPLLPPERLFIRSDELFAQLKNHHTRIQLHSESLEAKAGHQHFISELPPRLAIDARTKQPLGALMAWLADHSTYKVLFCVHSAGRREVLLDILQRENIVPSLCDYWHSFLAADTQLAITIAPLQSGLVLPDDGIAVIAESQLFGEQVAQYRRRKTREQHDSDAVVQNLTELNIGAPVVHIDHGVGRYRGLQRIQTAEQDDEFLVLEYAEQAKLYVPIAALHLISRYTGASEEAAPLHRLGSAQWQKAKRKASEKIHDVAAELLAIHARRAARQGHRFTIPSDDYARFAADFPFEETPDQAQAIQAVLDDLRLSKAMDRLVCGDVGFGKTEVAMRAAFVAVHNGKQVVILVPTTLLAQQHYDSFCDRFADWPVTIEVLSRFRSAKEQKQIVEAVSKGQVDILIGTHKLLQGNIAYHALGLLIIDEEHRFGVRQKEKLKALRAEVDILTLTATPIPRTLNMAMAKLRELSLITTPPARRLSIKTFVQKWNRGIIKEAIGREILRGGQVYYLHNEVKTIERVASELQELIPELRIGIGHGQLRERQLEQVMADFYHQRYNLLLCSTIIETGIDVPNANTIIINRADTFGLAQLHQLRGRVGRSHHQAYAYLLTPDDRVISHDAVKRLEAIGEAEALGAGFMLASHDLEIRGAGELLGDEQSGQIHHIGFNLYMDMLQRAVQALEAGEELDDSATLPAATEINLHIAALIPDDYLPDVHTRLLLYKRIANAASDEMLRELEVEMIDRFGLLPVAIKNLFRCTRLKLQAQQLGISKVEVSARGGKIEFADGTVVNPDTLIGLIQQQPATYRLASASALGFTAELLESEQRFTFVETLVDKLRS